MILLDSRDGSRGLADLPVLDGYCELTRLEWGDAMLTGHGPGGSTISVGVEVKSITDLIQSIGNGRLGATQIPGMLRTYDHNFLLYYGEHRPGPGNVLQIRRGHSWRTHKVGPRAVPWAYLQGWLLTASMLTPLRIVHVQDEHEVGCWLRTLDHWLEKPWDKHKALAVFDRSRDTVAPPAADPVEVQIARTAASLPAIDFVRGFDIAHHFNSVQEFINASRTDLMDVPGIGPVIALAVHDAINRRKGK